MGILEVKEPMEHETTIKNVKMKKRKDSLFVFILAVVTAGLLYQTISLILYTIANRTWTYVTTWILLFCNCVAIYAVMYLLKVYRQRVKSNNV